MLMDFVWVGQGENLYMSSGDASLEDAVRAWLDEEKNYHGEKIGEGDFASFGHYSTFSFSFSFFPSSCPCSNRDPSFLFSELSFPSPSLLWDERGKREKGKRGSI